MYNTRYNNSVNSNMAFSNFILKNIEEEARKDRERREEEFRKMEEDRKKREQLRRDGFDV